MKQATTDKFNWDLIMQEKTCVRIKNEKQFSKIKEEFEKKFDVPFFINASNCECYDFRKNNDVFRKNIDFFIVNNYTILKYKDIKIRKENIVCEKETFHDWLKKHFESMGEFTEIFDVTEDSLLKYSTRKFFYSNKEYTDFLVEKIIIKCIEYYNNMYNEYVSNYWFIFDNSTNNINYDRNISNIQFMKKQLFMYNHEVYENVRKEMTNFNGKNLLKYHFTGEF